MIKLKLGEMLEKRSMTAYALHIKSGLHQSVISKIKNNKSKALQLDVLDTLCKALECQPGELIAYENENATQDVNTQSVNDTQSVKVSGDTQSVNATQFASDNEKLYSTAEIAVELGINERTVRDNYNNGKLPFVKRGTKNLVKESDFIAFRDSRKI
jgi:putative transcriptional regulator